MNMRTHGLDFADAREMFEHPMLVKLIRVGTMEKCDNSGLATSRGA